MLRIFLRIRGPVLGPAVGGRAMMFVKLLGAIRTLEFMAFTRNTGKGDSQNEQGEKFHRGAS